MERFYERSNDILWRLRGANSVGRARDLLGHISLQQIQAIDVIHDLGGVGDDVKKAPINWHAVEAVLRHSQEHTRLDNCSSDWTVLHAAARDGKVDMCKLILEQRPYLRETLECRSTEQEQGSESEAPAKRRRRVVDGVEVKSESPMQVAERAGHTDLATFLLAEAEHDCGVVTRFLKCEDFAASKENAERVLAENAWFWEQDSHSYDPHFLQKITGAAMAALVEVLKQKDKDRLKAVLDFTDADGASWLHRAVRLRDVRSLKALLTLGEEVNHLLHKTDNLGDTPMSLAMLTGESQAARLIGMHTGYHFSFTLGFMLAPRCIFHAHGHLSCLTSVPEIK